MGDLVAVGMEAPTGQTDKLLRVTAWGRIIELDRYNPFLPAEAGQELADEGIKLLDTVLSFSRDQTEAKVLVLGMHSGGYVSTHGTAELSCHARRGSVITRSMVRQILTGDEDVHRLKLGSLVGRRDVEVNIKTNPVVARHMAILAMTGGGKTVAARRVIKELLAAKYPLVILTGLDYLGFWTKRDSFKDNTIRLFYPHVRVQDQNFRLIAFLVREMTQGLTEPQREAYETALEQTKIDENGNDVGTFITRLIEEVSRFGAARRYRAGSKKGIAYSAGAHFCDGAIKSAFAKTGTTKRVSI